MPATRAIRRTTGHATRYRDRHDTTSAPHASRFTQWQPRRPRRRGGTATARRASFAQAAEPARPRHIVGIYRGPYMPEALAAGDALRQLDFMAFMLAEGATLPA